MEGEEWSKDFNRRRVSIRDDAARIAQLRSEWLHDAVDTELAGIKLAHGNSKTPRKFSLNWGDDKPTLDGTAIPVWVRDEWNVTESHAKQTAAENGTDSPIVFVFLPKINADTIRDALATHAAAVETIGHRPEPQTDEGKQAKSGMKSRVEDGERQLTELFGAVIDKARVLQGGGNELTKSSLRDGVEAAGRLALSRQFPKFELADNANWGRVMERVRDGAPDALEQVDWRGEVTANPVCKEVLASTSGAGTNGSDMYRQLEDKPYGWPKDSIGAALLVLLVNGYIRAEREGQPVQGAKELRPSQIGKTTFYKEDEPPSATERMTVRRVLAEAGVHHTTGQEAAAISGLLEHVSNLAERAGGDAPLPRIPDTSHVKELQALAGNQQFRAVAEVSEQLRQDIENWSAAGKQRDQRMATWVKLDQLLSHASWLDGISELQAQREAVFNGRLLLENPDPVAPLIDQLAPRLRESYTDALARVRDGTEMEIAALEDSQPWHQLSSDQQEAVLADTGLLVPELPDVSDADKLLAALSVQPLSGLRDRVEALPAKAVAARTAIAEIIDPEPRVAAMPQLRATLRSESDVDDYLAELRAMLMKHIDAGDTVIT